MAVLVAVNFLAMRIFARVNNILTWWKVAVPVLAIVVLLFKFQGGNFTPGGSFLPGGIKALFAFVVADLLIYWSGFEVIWKLGVVLVIGYVLMGITIAFDPQRPPLQWRSAVWMPVWLIGMGIISWQGQFAAARSSPRFPPATSGSGTTS